VQAKIVQAKIASQPYGKGLNMNTHLFVVTGLLAMSIGCTSPESTRATGAAPSEPSATAQAIERDAEAARVALSKRLDQLDADIERVEARAKKASNKTKARLEEQGREMRAEARRLRDRMSTWDDKAESAWRTSKREIEEGLDKTEDAFKKLWADIKD